MTRKHAVVLFASLFTLTLIAGGLFAQRGPGQGFGRGKGGPGFRGGRQDPTFAEDHEVFHFLLDNGGKIRRKVKNLKNGIETLTESNDPEVAAKIQEHVAAMYDRLKEKRPIRMRDPLFRELFRNADKVEMKTEETKQGIRVIETSKDPYVVKLLQEHAKVVTLFAKKGRAEAHKNHAVPKREGVIEEKETTKGASCCREGKGCPKCLGKKSCCQGDKNKTPAKCCRATKTGKSAPTSNKKNSADEARN